MLGHAAIGRFAIGQTSTVIPTVLGEVGAFTLTGQASRAKQTRKGGVGSFTLTGQAASRQITAQAAAGEFTLTGNAVGLASGYVLVASPEVIAAIDQPMFAAIGQLALGQSGSVAGQATTFLLGGNDALFERAAYFSAATGAFTWTGIDAGLTRQGYPNIIRIFPRVAFGVRGGTRGGGPHVRPSVRATVRARAFGG